MSATSETDIRLMRCKLAALKAETIALHNQIIEAEDREYGREALALFNAAHDSDLSRIYGEVRDLWIKTAAAARGLKASAP